MGKPQAIQGLSHPNPPLSKKQREEKFQDPTQINPNSMFLSLAKRITDNWARKTVKSIQWKMNNKDPCEQAFPS